MAINIYTVQQDVERAGWKLVSTEYKNLKTAMDFICPKGHEVTDTYENWRKRQVCPVCFTAMETTNIRNKFPPKEPNTYRIIGLDAATETTGYSIFDNKKLVAYGTFVTIHVDEPAARINQVKKWLEYLCNTCEPDAIGVEGIQYQKERGVKTFQTLANLQGVLLDFLYENKDKYQYKVASSSAWRSYLGLNHADERESAKKRAQQFVKLLYSLDVSQDEADAICMGKYFLSIFKEQPKITWGEEIL